MRRIFLYLIAFIFPFLLGSQSLVDSLWKEMLASNKSDSSYYSNLISWGEEMSWNHPDSLIERQDSFINLLSNNLKHDSYFNFFVGRAHYKKNADSSVFIPMYRKAAEYALAANDSNLYCRALNESAIYYQRISALDKSISTYSKVIEFSKHGSSYYRLEGAKAQLRQGNSYNNMGNYNASQPLFTDALKVFETYNDSVWQSYALGNLGNAYSALGVDSLSRIYHRASLKIKHELNDIRGLGTGYNNYGNTFQREGQTELLDSAIFYLKLALFYKKKSGNKLYISSTLHNLGEVYRASGDLDKSVLYYDSALVIRRQLGNMFGISSSLSGKGHALVLKGDLTGFDSTYKAMEIAEDIGSNDKVIAAIMSLCGMYEHTRDFENAYKYRTLQADLRDSIFNSSLIETLSTLRTLHEVDQKDKENKILIQEQSLSKERDQKRFIIILSVAVVMVIIILMLYASFKTKQKANDLLKGKNNELRRTSSLLKESQKEILDSINYAKRIQDSMLTTRNYFEKEFPSYGLFYKGRDIVSGDFYWAANVEGKKVVIVADSTGHGVPGAFLSLIGIKLLHEIVEQEKTTDSSTILNKLNERLIKDLSQNATEEVKDAMDITVIVYNEYSSKLQVSGACHKLIHIGSETNVIRLDRIPLGNSGVLDHQYSSEELVIQKGDKIVMFSDGIIDQFGGPNNEKFKGKRFMKVIEEKKDLHSNNLVNCIEDEFNIWKEGYDQLDDVCVMSLEF